MTFEQAFDKIKEKFAKADASKTEDFAMQITLTDEDCGGTMYIAVKDGVLAVEPYDYHDNTSYLNITKSTLLAVLSGRASLDKAIASGDALMGGNASDMAAVKSTIKKPAAKASAKKPAAKKSKAAPKAAKTTAKKAASAKTSKAAPKAAKTTAKKAAPAKTAAAAPKTEAPKAEAPKAATKPAAASTTAKTTK